MKKKSGKKTVKIYLLLFSLYPVFMSPQLVNAEYKFTISPSVTAGYEYYDKNYRGETKDDSDTITTISPGIEIDIRKKDKGIHASYKPEYTMYRKNTNNDIWRQEFNADGELDFTKHTTLSVSESYIRTEEEPYDDFPTDDSYPVYRNERLPYYSNTADIRLDHQFGEKDSLYAEYTNSILNNEDEDVQDHMWHKPAAGFNYWFTRHLGLEGDLWYARSEYDAKINDDEKFDKDNSQNRKSNSFNGDFKLTREFTRHLDGFVGYTQSFKQDISEDGDETDTNFYNPFLGIDYMISKDFSVSFALGYRIITGDDDEDSSKLSLDAEINKSWSFKRGSMSLRGITGYRDNFADEYNDGFSQFFTVEYDADYGFSRTLDGNLKSSYNIDINEITDKKVNRGVIGAGLNWQAQKRLSFNLFCDYTNQLSDNSADDFSRYFATAGVSYTPLEWLNINSDCGYGINDANSDGDSYDEQRFSFETVFTPYRWLNMSCRYEYKRKDADYDDDSYDENRVYFKITVSKTYPKPSKG